MSYHPHHVRNLVSAAVMELEQDRLDLAQSLLDAAIAAAPHEPVPHFLCGITHYRRANFRQAEPLFRQALALSPGQPDACLHLAQTLRALKRPQEAIAYCQQALRARPDLSAAVLELARAQEEIGAVEEAKSSYRGILAGSFDLAAVLGLTALLNQQDCFTESEMLLRTALQGLGNA